MLLNGNLNGVQHLGIFVADIEAAKSWYTQKLGFRTTFEKTVDLGGTINLAFLEHDDLLLELVNPLVDVEAIKARGHGPIDHFALEVTDIDAALAEAQARGATLQAATAEGVVHLPMLGQQGVKYVFLEGPQGEKVELNQDLAHDPARRGHNLGGWAHLGIFVTDLPRSQDFWANLGFEETLYGEIPDGDGVVRVSMMSFRGFTVELVLLHGQALAEVRTRQAGPVDHIALDVNDIDAALAELKQAGLPLIHSEPVPVPLFENGVRFFMISGPDGERIEFNQVL